MLAAHLLIGALVGFIAGVCSWVAGLPVWATVLAYIFAGSFGVLGSTVVMVLRAQGTSAARQLDDAASLSRTQTEGPTYSREAFGVVIAEQHRDH